MQRIIHLIKIAEVHPSIINTLKINIEKQLNQFDIEVEILEKRLRLRILELNLRRKQYNAAKILKRLTKVAKNKGFFRILGIIEKDIYSKNYNFIFGLANRGYYSALISIARLTENFYAKTRDYHRKLETTNIFNDRILKEAIHELGHTFRLKHCSNICIMQFSNSLADTDKKPIEFCESCLIKLKKVLN